MDGLSVVSPARVVLALGLLAGAVVGSAVALAGSAVGRDEPGTRAVQLEAVHLPPLLTTPGEAPLLRYDVHCVGSEPTEGDEVCDAWGSVFARITARGRFTEIPLEDSGVADSGRLVARVPDTIASSPAGFEYFARLETTGGGAVALPSGGAAAPQRSLRLEHAVEIDLGRHLFGHVRRPNARVARAAWGSGPRDAGLEEERNLPPIGATAFDVDRTGAVSVLDESHRRVLRWAKGDPVPARIPISVSGTQADMTVAADGSIYVLETIGEPGRGPLVRRFDADGRELAAVETSDRSASQIRMGASGPEVLQQPSHQWMPAAVDGVLVEPRIQRLHGRAGRPVGAGREVVVFRRGDEIRVAIVGPTGVQRSWRIKSRTPLAEVQLAEPVGERLVLVARTYTDTEDEFVVLVLDGTGLVGRFSIGSMDWAETAPLGRFKLLGSSLYQLGSTPADMFVDRFDLEVR